MIDVNIGQIVDDIKKNIGEARVRIFENANSELLYAYYKIGKVISMHAKYGSKFIEELSIGLRLAFPESKGFSKRNLSRMKGFYE